MTVYVLHIEPPYQHARHYTGYPPDKDASRRIREHLDCTPRGSPLVRAAIEAGCDVQVAHVFKRVGRDFEKWLKTRRDHRKWCPCCGLKARPLPHPKSMTGDFKARKAY